MKSTSRKFPNKSAYFADPFPLVFILFRSRFFYYLLFTRQTEAGKKFGNSFRNMKDKRGIFSSFFFFTIFEVALLSYAHIIFAETELCVLCIFAIFICNWIFYFSWSFSYFSPTASPPSPIFCLTFLLKNIPMFFNTLLLWE